MKLLISALALIILTAGSCKSKTETGTQPPVIEQPAPTLPTGNNQHESSEDFSHGSGKCHCHKHKKRIPPGHAKKMHGDRSARNYAPGRQK